MSLIATAAAASAASPTVNLFTHGHKKGSHAGAKDGTASSSTQGPATTQSLLSSLFESIEQVMGISLTAPPRAVSAATPAAGAVTATAGPATTPNASTSFSGIGAHINTKA
jgi:type IV secretory pathway ATPase VirB11/archaellum biosynthesis ATPase